MTDTATVPTSGNTRSMGREARRLVLFDQAKDMVGGARALGEIIGVGRRSVNHRLVADRRLSDFELKMVADDLDRRACEHMKLAAQIRGALA
jgi:chemotaxis receptor (MCP) glutamine deamidase CheD